MEHITILNIIVLIIIACAVRGWWLLHFNQAWLDIDGKIMSDKDKKHHNRMDKIYH